MPFNPLNPESNPICHLLALLGAHHILHVSRISVKTNGPSISISTLPPPPPLPPKTLFILSKCFTATLLVIYRIVQSYIHYIQFEIQGTEKLRKKNALIKQSTQLTN